MGRRIAFNPGKQPSRAAYYLTSFSRVWILLGLAGVIIVGVAGIAFVNSYKKQQEQMAANALSAVQHFVEKGQHKKALQGEQGISMGLLAIIQQYSHTKAGRLAHLYVGIIYMKKRNYAQAITHLKAFSADDLFMQARALAFIGDAYYEQAAYEQATSYYQQAAKCKPNEFFTPSYLMKAAQVYEKQKNYAAANKCYQSIIEQFPNCSVCLHAKKHVARLQVLQEKDLA